MKKIVLMFLILLMTTKLISDEIRVMDNIKTNFDDFISVTFNEDDNMSLALSRQNKIIYQFNDNWNYRGLINSTMFTDRHLKGMTYDENDKIYWFSDFFSTGEIILFKTNKDFVLLDSITTQLFTPSLDNQALDIDVDLTNDTLWLVYNTDEKDIGQPRAFQVTKTGDLVSSFTVFSNYMGAAINANGIAYDNDRNMLWIMADFGKLFAYSEEGNFIEFIDFDMDNFCIGLDYDKNKSELISYHSTRQNIAKISASTYEMNLIPFGFFRHNNPQALEIESEMGNFWSVTTLSYPWLTEVSPEGILLRTFDLSDDYYSRKLALTVDSFTDRLWLSRAYVYETEFEWWPPSYVWISCIEEYTKDFTLLHSFSYSGEVQGGIILSGRPTQIRGLSYDSKTHNLWAVDEYTTSVLNMDTSGTIIHEFSTLSFGATHPVGIAYDQRSDNLWILDANTNSLYHVWKDGELICSVSIAHITTSAIDLCYEGPGVLWLLDSNFAYRCDISSATAAKPSWQLYY